VNEPEIAPASEADLRAMASRRCANDGERATYLGFGAHAPRGAWVARDAGEPVGIAFTHDLEGESFISELWVEPSFRGSGVGKKLFRAATEGADDAALAALLDANDAPTLAFFARAGIGLQTPVLHLAGEIPKEDALLPLAAGDYRFATIPIDAEAHAATLAALDREVRGSARGVDHRLFAEHAAGTILALNDEPVGYVYVWPDGRIGPIASASAAYVTQFFSFALVAMRRTYGASWCKLLVPGSNARLLRAAVRIGLKVDRTHIFATDMPSLDLSRYVGFHPLAF
jgi:GNAT superfamily N-acetyltransferase